MSADQQTDCPHCGASFSVNEEQLQSADGQVRCGACLQVFNANNGDTGFIAPTLSEEPPLNPFLGLSVQPMENAELPLPARPTPWGLKIVLTVLLLMLAGQLAWHRWQPGRAQPQALSVAQLVVRADPEQERALRLDAILHNTSDQAQPYPALFLYLDNRYGERRGERLFLPEEYLPGHLLENRQLNAHTRVQISLALQDPGQGAINYGLALQQVSPAAEN